MSDARANPLLDSSVQLSVPGPLCDEAKLPVPSLAPTTMSTEAPTPSVDPTPGERVDAISCPGYLFWLLLLLLLYKTFDYGLAEGWWLVAWGLLIVWKLLRPTKTLVRMCMAKDCNFSRPPSTADDAIDPEAAFPTAQLVAAMRANDAEWRFPKIGSNVGAGPDIYARALAGEKGKDYLADILMAFGSYSESKHESHTGSMVARTQFIDEHLMEAVHTRDVRQIVILAAGLDARAFRLSLPADATVYEVDVPRAHAYKTRIVQAQGWRSPCLRRVVEADLADPSWSDELKAAGFDPSCPSFIIIEGLLMYLPPRAPQALLSSISSLMAPGSQICGDCMVNYLSSCTSMVMQQVLGFWGTSWTYEVSTFSELRELLGGAPGLAADTATIVVLPIIEGGPPTPAPEAWAASIYARLVTSLCCGVAIIVSFPTHGWRACCSPVATCKTLLCCHDSGYSMYLVEKTGDADISRH
eukprot:COSAG02_NODE_39_length_48074_cov_106.508890_2_plen_470_part_00